MSTQRLGASSSGEDEHVARVDLRLVGDDGLIVAGQFARVDGEALADPCEGVAVHHDVRHDLSA